MKYEHNKKAGNEEDAVKHIALIAALTPLLESHQAVFHYCDTFAGYSTNKVVSGASYL